jgi:hypothetical protein
MNSFDFTELKSELTSRIVEVEQLSVSRQSQKIREAELPKIFGILNHRPQSGSQAQTLISKEELKAFRKDEDFLASINKYSDFYLKAWGYNLNNYQLLSEIDLDINWEKLPEILIQFWKIHLILKTGYRDSIEKFVYKLYRRKLAFRGEDRRYMKEMGVSKYPLLVRILFRLLFIGALNSV